MVLFLERELMDGDVKPLCQCLKGALKDHTLPRQLVLIKTQLHELMPTKQAQSQKWKVMGGFG